MGRANREVDAAQDSEIGHIGLSEESASDSDSAAECDGDEPEAEPRSDI